MDSVREYTTHHLEDIGGWWYTNQNKTKEKKVDKLSNIKKVIEERSKKANILWDYWMI